MRKLLLTASLFVLLALAASPARAQGYFAPYAGYDFGGDAGACPSILNDCNEKKAAYGVTLGRVGGLFGIEEDLGYAPDFFGASDRFGENSVLTMMTNLVVALPLGGVRPYVSAGLGLMRTRVTFDSLSFGSGASQNALGYGVGGGVLVFFPHHLGLRADYRHLRSTKDLSVLGIDITNTKISFSRVSVGLVLH
jgi:opacity protein-like surface antigen